MSALLAKPLLAPMPTVSLSYGASAVQRPRGTTLFARVLAGLRWVTQYPTRAATVAELSRLSDRELSDIGLTRADVADIFARR